MSQHNTNQFSRTEDRPILIIDGFNIFLRSFMVNEDINSRSEPIGGVVGFLKFINKITYTFFPEEIYVVWENGKPSRKRRKIYPEYKKNRNKINTVSKVSKSQNATMKEQLANDTQTKVDQLSTLYKILKTTPINQIYIKDVEADDIIAYLVKNRFRNRNSKKIIASSDRDFYQLLEDQTVQIYDPAKAILIDNQRLIDEWSVAAHNFCLLKALQGDDSDNIGGVPGVGHKSAVKRFSCLTDTNKESSIDDLIEEAKTNQNQSKRKYKIYENVMKSKDLIKRNWNLIYLDNNSVSYEEAKKIDYMVDNHKPTMNKIAMIKEVMRAGINSPFDFERFSSHLRNLTAYSKG